MSELPLKGTGTQRHQPGQKRGFKRDRSNNVIWN